MSQFVFITASLSKEVAEKAAIVAEKAIRKYDPLHVCDEYTSFLENTVRGNFKETAKCFWDFDKTIRDSVWESLIENFDIDVANLICDNYF